MAFESLSDKITGVFKRLKNKGKLTESDVTPRVFNLHPAKRFFKARTHDF